MRTHRSHKPHKQCRLRPNVQEAGPSGRTRGCHGLRGQRNGDASRPPTAGRTAPLGTGVRGTPRPLPQLCPGDCARVASQGSAPAPAHSPHRYPTGGAAFPPPAHVSLSHPPPRPWMFLPPALSLRRVLRPSSPGELCAPNGTLTWGISPSAGAQKPRELEFQAPGARTLESEGCGSMCQLSSSGCNTGCQPGAIVRPAVEGRECRPESRREHVSNEVSSRTVVWACGFSPLSPGLVLELSLTPWHHWPVAQVTAVGSPWGVWGTPASAHSMSVAPRSGHPEPSAEAVVLPGALCSWSRPRLAERLLMLHALCSCPQFPPPHVSFSS